MTELRGPADADHFRVRVGRYGDRWYTDPLPGCDIAPASDWHGPSVSATKPPFANKFVPMRSIAEMSDDEWRRLAEVSPENRYEAIKTHDKNTSRVNMRRGTIVHQWAEDLLAGRPITPSLIEEQAALDQAERFRASLEAFFDAYQPEAVAVEVPCLHRSLNGVGYGGTADVFAKVNGGIWAIDWKSRNSDHGAYLEEAAQGGAYCGAEYMIIDAGDGTAKRAPIPEVDGVLIVSITADSFKCYPIDRDGAIKAYAEMHRWWVAQNEVRDNKVIGRPWAPKTATKTATSVDGTDARQADEPSADVVKARVAELVTDGHADTLKAAWPFRADGTPVPTFKAGGHQPGDMALIDAAVARVRRQVEAPFDVVTNPQPRVETNPQPVVEATPDEGGMLPDGKVAKLREAFAALAPKQLEIVTEIARDANAAGRSISVATTPTVRRGAIAEALIEWAASGSSYDELWAAVSLAATSDQTQDPDQRLGALLGRFDISQAESLRDAFRQTAAA